METYKSERFNDRASLFKKWVLMTLIVFIPVLVDLYFPQIGLLSPVIRGEWILAAALFSVTELIDLFQRDTINEVTIDTLNNQVIFKYYDANEGQVSMAVAFANLQVKCNRLIWFRNPNVTSIYFFSGKNKMYEISKWKDGFSTTTLNNLSGVLESLTRPLSK
ncbi:MAG: hypothetical protein ABIN67_05255 [Ferruginibacter sp.]